MHETLFSLMSGKNFDEGLYQYKDPPSTECINNPQNDKGNRQRLIDGLAWKIVYLLYTMYCLLYVAMKTWKMMTHEKYFKEIIMYGIV